MRGQEGIIQQQNSQLKIINVFRKASNKLYAYEVLETKNKKIIEKPVYYLPHPRPIYNKGKYLQYHIQPTTNLNFRRIFAR